jgi:hypothetical protein
VVVEVGEDGRLLASGPWEGESLDFVGGTRFRSGTTRYDFTIEGGIATRVSVDRVANVYILEAGAPAATAGPED